MTDPTEDIADALVAHTNQLPELSLAFEASKPEDPLALLQLEHHGVQVYFVPFGETFEEKIDRAGRARMSYQVTMMVIRKLENQITREVMGLLVRQLTRQIRGERMAGYVWAADETVTKFDLTQLHEKNQFVGIVRLTYLGTD